MACDSCYDNCNPKVLDKCIKYMGEDLPEYDICYGDPLSKLEDIIFSKLTALSKGEDSTVAIDLEDFPTIKDNLSAKDPSILNLIEALAKSIQDLKDSQEDEEIKVITVFDKKCLDVTGTVSTDSLLQAAVNKLCTISSIVSAFPSTYVKNSDVTTIVTQIINGTGTSQVQVQYNTRLFPNAPVPYIGSLSNFDNTGKGLSSQGFDRVFIMNGLNGTKDWRGRTVVGATRNVPGAAFDAAVDPSLSTNPNTNYLIGDKGGENYHKLSVAELPSHAPTINDPGHDHDTKTYINDTGISKQSNGLYNGSDNDAVPVVIKSEKSFTNITINPIGGNQYHENRQPFAVGVWIVYIPA